MTAREQRTGQTENGLHPRCGYTLPEQFFGDPEVRDTPIGQRKELRNPEAAQPSLIDRDRLIRRECRVERCVRRWGRRLEDRRRWRHTGQCGALRQCLLGILQQGAAVGGQVNGGVEEFHPGRQSTGQAPLRLLIGEPGESSHVTPVCASPICLIQTSQVPADCRCHLWRQRPNADPNPSLKMARAGLDHDAGLVPVVAHGRQDPWLGVIQINQNVAGVVVQRIGAEVDVKALAVAGAQEPYGRFEQQLGGRPKALAGERFSSAVVNQTDQIGVTGHGRELTENGLRRKKESNIVHGGTSLMHDRRHGVGMAAKGALYGETLQAPGVTNRIFNRHKRVCADPVQTNSNTSAFIPRKSALLSRAPQPTMASAIGYGKPELSTLPESGTFYFALTLVFSVRGTEAS